VTRTLRLDIDADPAMLGTARLFAVSEACTRAIARAPEGGRVVVEARIDLTGVEVEIRGPAVEPLEPTVREAIDIDLVPSLFTGAEERLTDGTLTIRFLAPAI
jgi:hypothetical protein